jgi:hypothetical protein
MPELISANLHFNDVGHRRITFKYVPIGQIFHADNHWWRKVSPRMAVRADCVERGALCFKGKKMCRILDSSVVPPSMDGLSYENFLNQAAL